jgi:rod shape-determining protein MreC
MEKINLKIKSKNKIKKIIVLIILALFVLSLVNLFGFSNNIKNTFFSFSSPIQKTFWQAGENISDIFSGLFKGKYLKEEIEKLLGENRELINKLVLLNRLIEENKILRESLDIGLQKDFNLIFTQAISRDIFHDSFLIDKGFKDGVVSNFPVITGEKVLLGRIGQVYDNYSEVILISNKESSFDAEVFKEFSDNGENNSSKIYGVAKGRGGTKAYLDLVSKEAIISKKDKIVTSSLGGIFPPGLLVGRVKEINRSDLDPFQIVEIEPAFSLRDLNYLFIITEW